MNIKKKIKLISLLCALASVGPTLSAMEQDILTDSMVNRVLNSEELENIEESSTIPVIPVKDEIAVNKSSVTNHISSCSNSNKDNDTTNDKESNKGYVEKILELPKLKEESSESQMSSKTKNKTKIAMLSLLGGIGLEKLYNYIRPWNPLLEEIKNYEEINKSSGYKLQLHFLNVGQGDCIIIRYFDSDDQEHIWMVDAGYNFQRGITDFDKYFASLKFKDIGSVDQLRNNKQSLLDAFILTRPHPDHYWNFPYVIKMLNPKIVYHSYLSEENVGFIDSMNTLQKQSRLVDVLKDLDSKCIETRKLKMENLNEKKTNFGYVIYKDEKTTDGLEIRAFPPVFQDSNVNDNSIILYITYKGKRILLMGDAEKTEEKSFMSLCKLYGLNLKNVDIVKIGHHGGFTSSSEEFVKLTNPDYAICSTGKHAALLGHGFNLHEWYPTINKWRTGAGQRSKEGKDKREQLCKILTTEEQGNIVVSIKEDSSIHCKRYNNNSLERTWWVKQALH